MPRMTWGLGLLRAGGRGAPVLAHETRLVDELPRQEAGVPRVLDAHLLEHLTHDQLDVLVVDLDALRLVHAQDLVDDVHLGAARIVATQLEQLRRVERALGEGIARADDLALADHEARAPRDRVLALLGLRVLGGRRGPDDDRRRPLAVDALDASRDLGEDGRALRVACLEQLDDARQAVRDVGAGDAALMERPHRELGARLADRLRRDDADGIADLARGAGGEAVAVAAPAHADVALAAEHRATRTSGGVGSSVHWATSSRKSSPITYSPTSITRPLASSTRSPRRGRRAAVRTVDVEYLGLDRVARCRVLLTDDHVRATSTRRLVR